MIASLNGAFDKDTVDKLHFLAGVGPNSLALSGDGVLEFYKLIGAGLAFYRIMMQNGPMVVYDVQLTLRGQEFVNAIRNGDLQRFTQSAT